MGQSGTNGLGTAFNEFIPVSALDTAALAIEQA